MAAWSTVDRGAAEAQLARILNSLVFQDAPRLRDLLQHVVEEALEGRSDQIKAYSIAVDVFHRGEAFDPQTDPIVRVSVGRLRRALERYYHAEGKADPVLISIPKGHYAACFEAIGGPDDDVDGQASAPRSRVDRMGIPTVAVPPLTFPSDDEAAGRVTVGLVQEIVNELTRCPELEVLRATSPALARFQIEGSVESASDGYRVSLSLADTSRHSVLWSETFLRGREDDGQSAMMQDVARITAARTGDIHVGAIPQVMVPSAPDAHDITPYEALMAQAIHFSSIIPPAHEGLGQLLEAKLGEAPRYAALHAALSVEQTSMYAFGRYPGDPVLIRSALDHALEAVRCESRCAYAHWALGLTHLVLRNTEACVASADSLLRLNPGYSLEGLGGWLLGLTGRWEDGMRILRTQMRLLVDYPTWWHHVPFLYYYGQGRYEESYVEALQMRRSDLAWDYLERAAALGQLGRRDEGHRLLRDLADRDEAAFHHPRLYLECFILQDDLVDHLMNGLEKAGLPHQASAPSGPG